MKKLVLTALLVTAGLLPALAQTATPVASPVPSPAAPYAATIMAAGLRADLTELASDAYEGRETGRPGQEKAAQYLIRQFAALGLRGPVAADSAGSGGYRQSFGIVSTVPAGPGLLRLGPAAFVGGRDFLRFGASTLGGGIVPVAAPVFRGHGLKTSRYDDYAGLPDVRGLDVVVLDDEPRSGGNGRRLLAPEKLSAAAQEEADWRAFFRKAVVARDLGARSLTVLSLFTDASFRNLSRQVAPALAEPTVGLSAPVPQPAEGAMQEMGPPAGISFVLTAAPLSQQLLGAKVGAIFRYRAECYKLGRPAPNPFAPTPFSVEFPEKREELTSANVLGYLEGTDKKDELLVVSAHYDHVGVQHDTIYNGADDDGSGTSAVLALARAFAASKAAGQGPRRSLLFLLNSGEEKGLLGSEYYTGHPVFPLASTIANLNIDMVGRTDKAHQGQPGGYVYLIGSDRLSPALHALSEATNQQHDRLKLDYKYNDPNDPEMLYYRSDHYNFARHGIPIIFYTSGLHADYHKATDDVDKIEFDKLEQRTRLVFFTAWELANREQRPAVGAGKL